MIEVEDAPVIELVHRVRLSPSEHLCKRLFRRREFHEQRGKFRVPGIGVGRAMKAGA